jgi:hypothetical protein
MGMRVPLRADYPVDSFPPQARVVLVDRTPDPRWSNEQLLTLKRVKGSDFQVVDTRSLRP